MILVSNPTHFESFQVYVPWMPWEQRGKRLSADFQLNGPSPRDEGSDVNPLDLTDYLQADATAGLASMEGPQTVDSQGWLPLSERLPYTVHFANAADATRAMQEVRIVTSLDQEADIFSFRLGDVKVGKINVHIPSGRALFQGDFDFSETEGFVLRVMPESTNFREKRPGYCKRSIR